MGQIKGQAEHNKFKRGEKLTRKEAILAHCYECNGFERCDCLGKSCPMYQFMPYKGKKNEDIEQKAEHGV